MDIVNQTNLTFAPLLGRINFPDYSLNIIVKGTFHLKHNERTTIAEEQQFPTGDIFYEDDEELLGAPRYESDFAFLKTHADLLFVGNCHTPGHQFMTSCPVRFQVGDVSNSLIVTGDRYWDPSIFTSRPSKPIPFKTLPLRYEYSFGGDGFDSNPIGKGYKKVKIGKSGKFKPLPNIETPSQRIKSPNQIAEPAGFGPLRNTWAPRFGKLGHYKRDYVKKRWPWFAEDFNWDYFNAAPSKLQMQGYLAGNENLFFENLHPSNSIYTAQLPDLRIRCFLNCRAEQEKTTKFYEVAMNLDTLWVDMDNEQLVLVWRGWSKIYSSDYDEIKHAYIVSEELSDPPHTKEYWYEKFLQAIAEEEESFEAEPVLDELDETSAEDAEIDQLLQQAEAQSREQIIAAGLDPDNLPAASPEEQAKEAELLKAYGVSTEESEELPLTRQQVSQMAARGESLAGKNLADLDLSELNLCKANLEEAILINAKLDRTKLEGANLRDANLSESSLKAAQLQGAVLSDADFTGSDLSEANLLQADISSTLFEKAIMRCVCLEQAQGKDTRFINSDLSDAVLIKSDLPGADFSSCILSNADFSHAHLFQATFNAASCQGIIMEGALINEIRCAEEADFTNGNFRFVVAHESIWENAILVKTDFRFAQMNGADFTGANLEEANFSAADLAQSKLSKAKLINAKFIQMNLFQGSLESAYLIGTDLTGSNLYGVEFYNTSVHNAKFNGANLKMTKMALLVQEP